MDLYIGETTMYHEGVEAALGDIFFLCTGDEQVRCRRIQGRSDSLAETAELRPASGNQMYQ